MTVWTSVKQARRHGFNVRKAAHGWQVAQLSLNGWQWSAIGWPTKRRALQAAYTWHTA